MASEKWGEFTLEKWLVLQGKSQKFCILGLLLVSNGSLISATPTKIYINSAVSDFLSNLTPSPFPCREGEQESKPLSVSGRGLERGCKNKLHIAFNINHLNIPVSVVEKCQLCALGKDAESLLSFCDKVDLIPTESSPAGIVAELTKLPQIHDKKVLIPAPEVVGLPEPDVVPNLITDLQQLGIEVTRVPTYMTQGLNTSIYSIELNLIRQRIIDVIPFSSTAEVESFLTMVNSQSDYERCIIACFGAYTTANARKLGMNVSIVGKDYSSFEGFAEAIARFFSVRSSCPASGTCKLAH